MIAAVAAIAAMTRIGPSQSSEWLMLTMIWVGSGNVLPSDLNIFSNTGTMKMSTPAIISTLNPRTSTG